MQCLNKNSYLQLGTSVDPRLINKAVRRAMRKTQFDPHDETAAAQRMTSMQPSLYAPWVDITRAHMGFERRGLRDINRDITSEDSLVKLQALHSVLDQVRISENAMFLVNLNIVYRLVDLLTDRDPIVREKVCLILMHLSTYYQGRLRIMDDLVVIDRLMYLFMRDRKEIRYAAANCFRNLTRHSCEILTSILKNEKIIENLLKMIKDDHVGIVIIHLESLSNLAAWDPTKPLKCNAFQVMLELMTHEDKRVVKEALECMRQICKHSVGKKLADQYDLMKVLTPYLFSDDLQVIISALGLMAYATITTMSRWRVKQFSYELSKRLVELCVTNDTPVLQLRALQVLIHMCDKPDMKHLIRKSYRETIINDVKIRTPEQWDGSTASKHHDVEFGHFYRTRYIEDFETIKNDIGDNVHSLSVADYLNTIKRTKDHLIKAIDSEPYKD